MATPSLDLIFLDTHNSYTLAIGDISQYNGVTVSTPTLEITVPNYGAVTLAFVANSVQVYNSDSLGITCEDDDCDEAPIPDGVYKVKYSIYPAYRNYIEKTFIRVAQLQEKFDSVYVKLDFMECDQKLKEQDKELLDTIQEYINGAISAANKCYNKLSMDLYRKASEAIDHFLDNRCYLK
jgi:major membrane immunogen (membrane-anchored lipoprotein)